MTATETKPVATLPVVEASIIVRFHKNLVAAGQGVQKNRGIIAKVAADLPAIVQGLDKDQTTSARRDMYIHIIAGCVASTPTAVEAAWKDQKTWSPDWLSAYGNARSIVSQACDAAVWTDPVMIAAVAKKAADKALKKVAPRTPNGATKPETTPATTTPADLKSVVSTAPADDLALALSKLPASTFASILAKAARMSYSNGLDAIDVHFADAIIAASLVREKEAAEPATPCTKAA
jgi:hypothetical protein